MTFSIIYAMMSFSSVVNSATEMGTSDSQMGNSLFQRLQTNISMSTLQDQSGTSPATFQITNTGNTVLWNYNDFDVLITYQENGTLLQQLAGIHPIVTEKLGYSSSCTPLLPDNWCISQIQNDNIHPGLLDPKEIADIEAQPANVTKSGGTFSVVFSTDNGVTSSQSVIIS